MILKKQRNFLFISLIAVGLNLIFYRNFYIPMPKMLVHLIDLTPYFIMLIITLFYQKSYSKKVYRIYAVLYLLWLIAFTLYLMDLTSVVYYDGDIIMKYAIPKQ